MLKNLKILLLVVVCAIFIVGCGETVSGIGKDTNRMGKGLSTFFFRQ